MALTILAFLAVLSFLVLAHELGHFIAARRVGIRVVEFGIGWPPRLLSRRVGDTLVSINLLPLGGFVRMFGEFGGAEPGSFMSKRPAERAVVILAGVAMNFALAPVLFALAFMVGEPVFTDRVFVREVTPNSPAATVGFQAGDQILTLNGVVFTAPAQISDEIERTPDGEYIRLTILRDGRERILRVVPAYNPELERRTIGVVLLPEQIIERHLPWKAAWLGIERTGYIFKLIGIGVARLISGEEEADLIGPVGIASLTGQIARAGLYQLLTFTGFLSMNLGIINLLPFPGLDGARFVFTVVEMVRRRPINPRREALINITGIILLLALTVFITYRDIVRLVG